MEKKKLKRAFTIFALTKVPFMIYLVVTLTFIPQIDAIKDEVVLGAHRGASIEYEENTLLAFEKAKNESKYQFIEFDIQYSKDREIVVFHQNNMFRIPKNNVHVDEMTYEEIQKEFDFHIPTYDEVMECIGNEKPVNIEIKSHGNLEDDKALVDFVIKDCSERGICNQIMISSISADVVKYIEEKYPEVPSGKIYWLIPYSIIEFDFLIEDFYKSTEADYIVMHGINLGAYDSLKELKPENKRLIIWYFTDEEYIIQEPGKPEGFWECVEDLE